MPRLLLVGALDGTRRLLDLLPEGDYSVTLVPDVDDMPDLLRLDRGTPLVLAALDGLPALDLAITPAFPARRIPWIAWNRRDEQALAVRAYEMGALAVLPGPLTSDALRGALRTAFARARSDSPPSRRAGHGPGRYARGARILLDDSDVLVVERGVVATSVLHEDGTEVLVGLAGPGEVLVGHPHDSCCLNLQAHTDARVLVEPWTHAVATPRFAERLRARLRRTDAWAAVQARPHLEDRLTGLLSLLAESFGRPHPRGTRLDVRLTHAQIASALGTTRATITRLVGRLRRQQILDTDGVGADERFVVRVAESHAHG